MLRTIAAVATAAALGVGAATTVAAAASMKAGPSPGGGAGSHPSMSAPSASTGPTTGMMVHGNAAGPNTAFAPKSFNGNWNQSWNQRWSGNWRDHDRFRHHHHDFVGFGLFAYEPGYYDYDYTCYQRRLIPTRYGWRWRLVWVCGPNY